MAATSASSSRRSRSVPLRIPSTVRPRSRHTFAATVPLSPVITFTSMSSRSSLAIDAAASGLGRSTNVRKPASSRSCASPAASPERLASVRVATATTRAPSANSPSRIAAAAGRVSTQRASTASGAPLVTSIAAVSPDGVLASRSSTPPIGWAPASERASEAGEVSRARSACGSDDGDLTGKRERRDELEMVTAPEPPGVIPARGPLTGEQAHVLVGRGHELCAIDRLRRTGAAHAAGCPLPDESGHGGQRPAVEAGDGLHEPVLVRTFDRALELPHPGPLVIASVPGRDGFAKVVELNAALTLPGPHVGKRATELGVPEKGRQIVNGNDHADVIDGAVGHGPNRQIRR